MGTAHVDGPYFFLEERCQRKAILGMGQKVMVKKEETLPMFPILRRDGGEVSCMR